MPVLRASRIGAAAAAASATVALCSVLAAPAVHAECRVAVIAHRGDRTTGHTEQSVRAMVLAAERGADHVELDVQAASDGVLYAMHDTTLARTVSGSPRGGIGDYRSTRIDAMRLRDGSRIPRVSDILTAVKPYGVGAFLELKAPRADTYARLRTLVLGFGRGRVVVSSFDPARLDAYHAVAPSHALALNTGRIEPVAAVARYQALSLRHTVVTAAYRDSLREAGLRLYVWSVNSPEAWAALPSCLDGVMTDRVGDAVTW